MMTTAERARFAVPNFVARCQRQLGQIMAAGDLDDADERDVIDGLLADAVIICRQRISQHRAGIVSDQPDFPDDVS
jgi:hypothetical protein